MKHLDKHIQPEIRDIDSVLYWVTTKTLLEFMMLHDFAGDLSLAEAWNFIYGPIIFQHDSKIEEKSGELFFFRRVPPTVWELEKMLHIGQRQVLRRDNKNLFHMRNQLLLSLDLFEKNLFPSLKRSYSVFLDQLREFDERSRQNEISQLRLHLDR